MSSLHRAVAGEGANILLLGFPGSGKTSLIGQLLLHGYKLRIIDFDRQLQPIASFVPGELHGHVSVIQPKETLRVDATTGRITTKGTPTAWPKFIALMNGKWVDPVTDEDFGFIKDWDDKVILVVESLGTLRTALFNFVLNRSNRLGQRPEIADWEAVAADAYAAIANLRWMSGRRCHFILTSHLQRLSYDISKVMTEEELQAQVAKRKANPSVVITKEKIKIERVSSHELYPTGPTAKFSETVGGLFQYIVQAKRDDRGVPFLLTTPDPDVTLRVPADTKAMPRVLKYQDALARLINLHSDFGGAE